MYNLGMDGQTEVDKIQEDVVKEALPVLEPVARPEETIVTPVDNTEAVVVEEVPIVPEAPVAPVPEPPVPVAPALLAVETPLLVEPVVVQETKKGEETEITAEQRPEKVVESVPEVADSVVGPELKRDPMEVARGLDHDVLEAAFRLLAQERSATLLDAKKKSDKKKVDENSDRVEKFVAQYKNGVRRTTIADKLNMSPSKVTDYLQRLIATGRVRGEGKTNDRRFYIS